MAEATSVAVASKVVDSLFVVAKKEISYMWNCNENVNKLKNEAEKLRVMRGRIQQLIDIASINGDNLSFGVQQWVDKADFEISKAEEFLEEEAKAKKTCLKIRLCGNWGTLYHHGKWARKKAPSLLEHQEAGKTFETSVSVYTPAPGALDVYENKILDDIDTHNSALGDIITAIKDDSKQIIGIYGLGGVGKTTLAKEIASKMKSYFDDVAFTRVSQTVNIDKVQRDIEKARKQIMQGKKILIILDDVWKKLNLEELCIPCGRKHMNCKILLTSRSEDVCNKMNAQSKIRVDPLPIEESWILCKQVIGEEVEADDDLKRVALKVVAECGGLPLFIQAVGNALKGKNIDEWNWALARLKKSAPSDIDPEIRDAFILLKLSYDYIESEEVKSCFLLCSMFREDRRILLNDLVNYGVGLGKFNDLESINDARYRVLNAVNILTSSGLLLHSEKKDATKMHDVVRDVALSIASKGNNKFLVQAGKDLSEWLPRYDIFESYTGISLWNNKISKLPDYELHFPHLNTFLVPFNGLSTISNEFIGGMKEARVLDISCNDISLLPQSLKLLTKLRMLNLEGNRSLHDISILGELKNLEILILTKTGIKEIPKEIGQMVNLRWLAVDYCENLCHVSPGVLSKLCWLEELHIGFFLMLHKEIYDSLVDVMSLSKLTFLDLCVPCFDVILKDFNWGKLNGFVIQIGGDVKDMSFLTFKSMSERRLVLFTKVLKIPFVKSIKKLIKESPATVLKSVENLNNIMPDLYHEGFNKLESIELENCPNVTCLVDSMDWYKFSNFTLSKDHLGDEGKTEICFFTRLKFLRLIHLKGLEILWNSPNKYLSLSNLVTLVICLCEKLVRVFSVGVAQGLVSLQDLCIDRCNSVNEVIWGADDEEIDDETDMAANIIIFPSLARISLFSSYRLKSFCSGISTIMYPSLVEVTIIRCSSMKKWGAGIQDTPKLKSVNDVLLNGPDAINGAVGNLKELKKKKKPTQSKIEVLKKI